MAYDDRVATPVIAIVDNDPGIVELIQEILADAGHATAAWSTADDPLGFLKRVGPAVIVLDLKLGSDFSALEVLAGIRADAALATTPVVICSADRATIHRHAAELRALDCDIVEKPFELEAFLAAISRAVSQADFGG